jgi:hypothetical protein
MTTHAREPRGSGCYGLRLAVWALVNGRRGPATEADCPPVSVLPHTRASAEALRLAREHERRFAAQRFRVVNRDGVIVRERASEAGGESAGDSTARPVSLAPPAGASNVVPITRARR